jgi:hypothetical protein
MPTPLRLSSTATYRRRTRVVKHDRDFAAVKAECMLHRACILAQNGRDPFPIENESQ